jgi:hypothetical protein
LYVGSVGRVLGGAEKERECISAEKATVLTADKVNSKCANRDSLWRQSLFLVLE